MRVSKQYILLYVRHLVRLIPLERRVRDPSALTIGDLVILLTLALLVAFALH